MGIEKAIKDMFRTANKESNQRFFEGTANFDPMRNIEEYDLGKCHMKSGNYHVAIRYFKIALSKSPKSSDAFWRKAKCHFEIEEFDDAVTNFQNSLAIKVDDNIFDKLFDCYIQMYSYDSNDKKDIDMILQKTQISLHDRRI